MKFIYKEGIKLIKEIECTNVPDGAISFWNLGQASILLKGKDEDGLICIDPYLTKSIEEESPDTEFKRAFSPVIEPNQLKNIDMILVTHNHGDHLDKGSLEGIAQAAHDIRIVVPAPVVSSSNLKLGPNAELVSAQQNESITCKGAKITPVPAAHTEYELDSKGRHFSLGYFIEVNGIKIFHSGDTVVTSELLEKVKEFKPDVAFLPINGRDYFRTSRGIIGNMNFREAVDFANVVGVDMLIPIHYDLFPNNRENPAYFVDYLFHQYPSQKFHMMAPGERFIYHK